MAILTIYNIFCVGWLVFGELSGIYTPHVLVRSVAGDFYSVSLILILTAFMVRFLTETLFQANLRLQKELKERKLVEEKYRNIVENAIDGIFQSTPEGRFLSVNPAMAHMYGYESPEEMIRSITDISSQIYVDPNVRNDLRRRLEDGEQVTNFEMLDYRKDRSTFWTSMNVQAIRDEEGNILFFEGTIEDITPRKKVEAERKQAERLIRESEERYRLISSVTTLFYQAWNNHWLSSRAVKCYRCIKTPYPIRE